MLGHTVYPTGDLRAARAIWEQCPDDAADTPKGTAIWSLSILDIDEGRPDAALERLTTLREHIASVGTGMLVPFVEAGVALAQAALGRFAEAREAFHRALTETAGPFAWQRAITLLGLARMERLSGDLACAHSSAEQALAAGEALSNPTLIARSRIQLARIASARGDWAGAEALAHKALATHAQRAENLDLPDTLDALAEVATGLQSLEEAARLIGAADQVRADLGLVRWLPEQERADAVTRQLTVELGEEAAASARREGEALSIEAVLEYTRRARGARKRPATGWESLTPTELEVVRHAASGLTNPEIAERMFVSRGTVKVHLSHVYAKLGLRNRAEVAGEAMRRGAQPN